LVFGWIYEVNGWVKAGAEMFADVRETFEGREDEGAVVAGALAATSEAKFLTNLGQLETAAPIAASAVSSLSATGDTLAYLIALESLSEIMIYRGDFDPVLELIDRARQIGDESGYVLYSAAMSGYVAAAYLQRGEVESALEILREGEQILVKGGDQMLLGWNLAIQGSIALMQSRLDDAALLHSRQVEVARRSGYKRVLALGLTGLGQIQIQRGEWSVADRTLCEGLELFERMGLATEMGYVTLKLAKVRSNTGDREGAAEAASCVRADPSSDRSFLETATAAESAAEFLDELSAVMEADAFASAVARGEVKGLDVMVKELLAERRTHPTAVD
jgi:ATP/maltotriose-dependent transcriptional regulator MalT